MRLATSASLTLLFLARPAAAQSPPAALVGTWRVMQFCDQDSAGAVVDPLGPSPTGYFIYTPTGQLSIHAMRTPPVGPLAGEPVHLSTLGALRPFVAGGTLPDYIGTDQLRRYRIRGDTLSIGAPPFPCRVLIRVREDGVAPRRSGP